MKFNLDRQWTEAVAVFVDVASAEASEVSLQLCSYAASDGYAQKKELSVQLSFQKVPVQLAS